MSRVELCSDECLHTSGVIGQKSRKHVPAWLFNIPYMCSSSTCESHASKSFRIMWSYVCYFISRISPTIKYTHAHTHRKGTIFFINKQEGYKEACKDKARWHRDTNPDKPCPSVHFRTLIPQTCLMETFKLLKQTVWTDFALVNTTRKLN